MRHAAAFLTCFLALACSGASHADGKTLALDRVQARSQDLLIVTSPAFSAGGKVPLANSAYGGNVSPAISWSGLPAGSRAIALIVEDPDAAGAQPFVHWLAWNVNPAVGTFPEKSGAAVRQGRNGHGSSDYWGPHPPAGPAHHYHFELFALDAPLTLAEGADRDQLVAAMSGHVLAKGELVGVFQAEKGR
jgi:Raf kinase inhibitor-like YbhB/YbcL family protein